MNGKVCTKCNTFKFVSEYPRDRQKVTGYRPDCKNCCNARNRKFTSSIENKKKIRKYKNKYRTENIQARLADIFRGRYKKAIKYKSTSSKLNFLGCTVEEWKVYLSQKFQPGMTWDNYGHKTWHIDHIVPISSFDLTKEDEIFKAFNYTNTQPMWAVDNLTKGNKMSYTERKEGYLY